MRLLVLATFALLGACNGCPTYTGGVPHLLEVEGVPNLYRSGQPPDELAVRYLAKSLKIQWVWKLNHWDEGDADKYFEEYGVHVEYLPMDPTTKPGNFDDYVDWALGPDSHQWDLLEAAMRYVWEHPEVKFLVHCVNGNDRTGAASGLATLKTKTISQARSYMGATGFHWQLVGLDHGWHEKAEKIKKSLEETP